jgi:hypothetical protein
VRRPVRASCSLGGSSRPRAAAAGAIALINAIDNLGGYVGPFVVGWIKDTTNSFEMALYFLAASSLASGAIGREFAAWLWLTPRQNSSARQASSMRHSASVGSALSYFDWGTSGAISWSAARSCATNEASRTALQSLGELNRPRKLAERG